ncbi:MAG: thioesterase family protein [Hyphomonadaceae bacterium]
MADAIRTGPPLYRLAGNIADPSADTHGPWNTYSQHGGAPTALIAHVADTFPAPAPMWVTRLTVDLMRPVPIAPLTISTTVLREGRNIQLLQINLSAGDKEVTRATALRVRKLEVNTPARAHPPKQKWPSPEDCPPIPDIAPVGLSRHVDFRMADGRFRDGAAAPIWMKLNCQFLEAPGIAPGTTPPLLHGALMADYLNGMTGALSFQDWTFINAELTIHFAREPRGDWSMVEATSWIGTDGRGIGFSTLSDREGAFGRASQSLVIEPRAKKNA